MSKALITSADLDEIDDLAYALQEIVNDSGIELFFRDLDEETGEILVEFTVEGKTHSAWFGDSYLRELGMYDRLLSV
jgi:hypothetical protein